MRKFHLFILLASVLLSSQTLSADESPLKSVVDRDRLYITLHDKPVLAYKYRKVPFKPYVEKLYTPNGRNILLDAPPDHLHHHGLMFALSVNGISYWEETDNAGEQLTKSIGETTINRDSLRTVTTLVWRGNDYPHDIMWENRIIKFFIKNDSYCLTWKSILSNAANQQLILSGAHYYGLGMRFIEEMDKIGTFINASGEAGTIFRGEERLVDADWCAYQATLDSGPVTVAMYHHPKNFKQTTWFTMATPFAYLSATLRYHEQSIELKKDKLTLQYGIEVWDKLQTSDDLDAAYKSWLESNP